MGTRKRTNYERGRDKEYSIIKRLKKEGYEIAQRSRGSHSPVDIWAINKEERKILLIQAKPTNICKPEAKRIEGSLNWLNDEFMVEFRLE
jgi:Holliday junction resolvase